MSASPVRVRRGARRRGLHRPPAGDDFDDDGGAEFSEGEPTLIDSATLDDLEGFARSTRSSVPWSQPALRGIATVRKATPSSGDTGCAGGSRAETRRWSGRTAPEPPETARYHVPEAVPEPIDEADRSESRDGSRRSSRPPGPCGRERGARRAGASRTPTDAQGLVEDDHGGRGAPRAEPGSCRSRLRRSPSRPAGLHRASGSPRADRRCRSSCWLVILALVIAAALWWFVL